MLCCVCWAVVALTRTTGHVFRLIFLSWKIVRPSTTPRPSGLRTRKSLGKSPNRMRRCQPGSKPRKGADGAPNSLRFCRLFCKIGCSKWYGNDSHRMDSVEIPYFSTKSSVIIKFNIDVRSGKGDYHEL